MSKNYRNLAALSYVSPACKSIAVKTGSVICGSDPLSSNELPGSSLEDWGILTF